MNKLKIIILLIMFGNCMIALPQVVSKIDDKLQLEMTQYAKIKKLRINILLSEQVDQTEMLNKTQFIKNKEEKRSYLINELKKFSQITQKNLIMFLSGMETKSEVSEIQSLWIVNMITCYASIETIEALSLRSDVLIIGLDDVQYMLMENNNSKTTAGSTREITYNITQVQANIVWALGYTGQNVIVAIIDTGVNYDHDDLAGNMWTHPNYPYHGWNFVSNNNNPMDDHSHGTHCAGTVAGQGASGSQTGMAPNAKIMAVKVWNSTGNGTTSQMCAGIQFAVDNGAHVISMSGGVPLGGTAAEKIQFRNTMINVLNMGIIAPIAAGNEGFSVSPPNSVRVPGNCPPPWLHPDQTLQGGLTAVISVGSTDQYDNIASSSSKGPVTWQTITGFNDYALNPGIGLIRPDVVAPGVNIKSLSHTNNSGYTNKSGTSMATPCVSGVIALMLSKNNDLTPAEICEILETTAVCLPTLSSPKGNTFGSGRIDAYAAVQAISCPPVNFINQTVTTNTTVTSCGDINAQNVKVQNNGKLIFDAVGEVNIVSDFEVQLGSELEIE